MSFEVSRTKASQRGESGRSWLWPLGWSRPQGFAPLCTQEHEGDKRARWCPEEEASWWSYVFFGFVNSLMRKGAETPLMVEDLWDVAQRDEAGAVYTVFATNMHKTQDPDTAPQGMLWKAIWLTHGLRFTFVGVLKVVHDCVMFASPYLLEKLLHNLHQGSSRGSCLAVALSLLFCKVFEALSINIYFHTLFNICLHVKSSLVETIYHKSLLITLAVRTDMGVGAIVNLQSNDASKIWMLPQYLHILWNGPFQILVVMGMLVRILGVLPAAMGLAITVAIIPASTLFNRAIEKSRKLMMVQTDARVKLVTEVITGIKAIKLYAWEQAYMKKLLKLRDAELEQVQRTEALGLYNGALYSMTPVLVSLAAFLVYSLQGKVIAAAVAFPALALFHLLSFPIVMLPQQIMNIIHARVSLGRIQTFLEAEEVGGIPLLAAPARHVKDALGKAKKQGPGGMCTALGLMIASPEKRHGPPYMPSRLEDSDSGSVHAGTHSEELSDVGGDVNAGHKVQGGETHCSKALGSEASYCNAVGDDVDNGKAVVSKQRASASWGLFTDVTQAAAVVDDFQRGREDQNCLIQMDGGQYRWDKNAAPVVQDLCLRLSHSQLIMVIGCVGSGKSSLLLSILGETYKTGGIREVHGRVAYTQQDPWIMNTTLRDNIIMRQDVSHRQYSQVLEACALLPDLEMLPAGDETEIGEKGINLSGGQKHRVALARACCANADIHLLDDPLSAVDAHVGQHLFEQCVRGLLGSKGRVLVTHQLQFLPAADLVVVMDRGRVLDCGTYPELVTRGLELQRLVAQPHEEEEIAEGTNSEAGTGGKHSTGTGVKGESGGLMGSSGALDHQAKEVARTGTIAAEPGCSLSSADPVTTPAADVETASPLKSAFQSTSPASSPRQVASKQLASHKAGALLRNASSGKLIKAEGRAMGRVDVNVYRTYITAWGPYFILPVTMLLMAIMEHSSLASQNFVLSFWSVATPANPPPTPPGASTPDSLTSTRHYLLLYVSLGGAAIVLQLVRTSVLIRGSVAASKQLHSRLLAKVVRLPLQFFDSQPSGRLLNRFTKDVEVLDVQVSQSVNSGLTCFTGALLSMVVIVYIAPPALAVIVPLGALYYQVQKLYIASSREIKRLDSITTSPIFQHFSETLGGLQTIRAFRWQELFMERNRHHLNASSRTWWPIQVFNRWLSVRLELMGALVVFCAALMVSVLLPVQAGLAGLAITSALKLTGIMNWMVRMATQLEVDMNSVERLIEYDTVKEEAPAVLEGSCLPADWPQQGAIEARGLWVRYRPELEPVLKDLNFAVRGGEKIGICGRTGCGKSTLMMALYRIVEPYRGNVYIDGIDTASLGLADLRGRLSLVPQDPVIFSGTVRSNLDPFDIAPNDAVIWKALQRTGMDLAVSNLGAGLDSPIKENGANLSVGQRQLLCMARALLRSSRILILDEATSNVDTATDSLIQNALRSCFEGCTLLTIAHRLHTIVDSDRVMVLDAGRVVELDAPAALLLRPNGVFKRLVDDANRQRRGDGEDWLG